MPKHSCLGLLRCPKLSPYPYPPRRVWGLCLSLLCPILAAPSGCSVHPWALRRALHASVRPREVGGTVENQQLVSRLKREGHGKFSHLSPSLYSLLWPALTWGYLCWLWPPTGHPRFKKKKTPGSRRQGKGAVPPPCPGSDGKSPHSKGRKKAGQIQRTLSLPGGGKKARYITELSLQGTARDSARPLTQVRQRDAGTAGTASVSPHAPGAHGR